MFLQIGIFAALGVAAIASMAPVAACDARRAQLSTLIADSTAPRQPAPDSDIARKKGDLSNKLDSTGGVIHPEGGVDPGMQKPAPPVGATPVVPPPGSPGGRQDVQPK
jgi:hypothetical protein